jgi:hypothetical protein
MSFLKIKQQFISNKLYNENNNNESNKKFQMKKLE